MSIFGTRAPRNRDRKRPGHPTQFAPTERVESDLALSQDLSPRMNTVSPLSWDSADQSVAASDPGTPAKTLVVLSVSEYSAIRSAVAANPSCPEECFSSLSIDSSHDVRAELASNTSVDAVTLSHLCRDAESYVVRAALRNPSISDETVARFYQHENWMFRESVASNSSCTETQFASLAQDDEEAVVLALITNKAVPTSVIDRIEDTVDRDDSFLMERIARHPNRTPHTNKS